MNMRNLALLGVVLFLLVALLSVMQGQSPTQNANELNYSELLTDRRKLALLKRLKLTETASPEQQLTEMSTTPSFRQWSLNFGEKLAESGVDVSAKPIKARQWLSGHPVQLLFLFLIISGHLVPCLAQHAGRRR